MFTSGVHTATSAVATDILSTYKTQTEGQFIGPQKAQADPYGAYVPGYWWGDNATKSGQGGVLATFALHGLDAAMAPAATKYAERYVHYIHGVNPLGLVYLSAMNEHGAEKSVTRIFHSWFGHGTTRPDGPCSPVE